MRVFAIYNEKSRAHLPPNYNRRVVQSKLHTLSHYTYIYYMAWPVRCHRITHWPFSERNCEQATPLIPTLHIHMHCCSRPHTNIDIYLYTGILFSAAMPPTFSRTTAERRMWRGNWVVSGWCDGVAHGYFYMGGW